MHLFIPAQGNVYRPRLLSRGPLIVLLFVVLLSEGVFVAHLIARHAGNDFLAAVIESEILSLTNEKRASNGLAALKEEQRLILSAQQKANDMAARGYFAHTGPDGREPWSWIERAGYDYRYAGENLAVRFVDSGDVINAWMASSGHRANILKPQYSEVGVGIAQGVYKGQLATFVVQHFATPFLASSGVVLAAETGPSPSFGDTFARQLARALAEPRAATGFILGGIVALLALALSFAFFHHIQIQSHDLLLSGVVVAGIALALLALNGSVLSLHTGIGQPASAYGATEGWGVMVGTATSTERQL